MKATAGLVIFPTGVFATTEKDKFVKTFLQRDAMHKRGLCRHAVSVYLCVCLSVCVPVTFVDCVKTNKNIFEIFSPSSSHTILVFPHQTR